MSAAGVDSERERGERERARGEHRGEQRGDDDALGHLVADALNTDRGSGGGMLCKRSAMDDGRRLARVDSQWLTKRAVSAPVALKRRTIVRRVGTAARRSTRILRLFAQYTPSKALVGQVR